MRRSWLGLQGVFPIVCVGLAVLCSARQGMANGRYPNAQQVLVDPRDPGHLWLRATYGILTSFDRGSTWSWVCESAVGYLSGEDPAMALTADGTVLAGASLGLFVGTDGGCSWTVNPEIGQRFVHDLTTTRDGTIFALTSLFKQGGSAELVVWRSSDSARSFQALGPAISWDVQGLTLDVAPSDPTRIYVTGIAYGDVDAADAGDSSTGNDAGGSSAAGNKPGALLRSEDGGATWNRIHIPGTGSLSGAPFIAAIHPTNPNALYVRVQGPTVVVGTVESWLLYSDDAGNTWQEIFRGPADMLGFALSPDGSTVSVGLGDSRGRSPVDPTALGIYNAQFPALAFTRAFRGQVGCLLYSDSKLFVCGENATTGFELGISGDDGLTVSGLVGFDSKIAGPLDCQADSSVARFCAFEWPTWCSALQVCKTPPDAGLAAAPDSPPSGGCACDTRGYIRRSGSELGGAVLEFALALLAFVAGVAWRKRASGRRECEGRR